MDFKFIFNLQLFAEGEEGKGDPSEGGEGGKPPATDPETKKWMLIQKNLKMNLTSD